MLEKDDKIGDYKLEKFLGRGQFGEVWLAEKQLQFSTRTFRHALKFLFNGGDEIDLKSAEAEIDTWIEASGHPNVMSVMDMLLYRDYIIIVSEFAEGGSLKGWLAKNGGKAPSPEKALEMITGILRGIEHLHAKSVVHRDLKPDNILLQGNFPRITDFGISRIVSSGSMSTKAMGSPAYMSPESFAGNKSPQTDIWSAGVLLYEMLSGDFPFESETIYGLVNSIQQDELKPLPETVAPELRTIVEKALQKDREQRFQTAREMRLAIERASYEIKARAERSKESKKVLPSDEKEVLPPKQSAIETLPLKQSVIETLPLKQEPPKIHFAKPKKTDDKEIVPTKDWRELEHNEKQSAIETLPLKQEPTQSFPLQTQPAQAEKIDHKEVEHQQNELRKIGRELAQTQGEKKSKSALLAVVGGILGVTLIGGLFWAMSGTGSSPTVVNAVKNTSVNDSAANNSNKSTVSTAPTGMAYVPGGEFMMGRDDGKSDAEKPAHKVTVSPFFMDIYEMTVKQYANSEDYSKALPKVGVNWAEADASCKKIGKRLPTEEEWEFAARGTENFIYPWGNEWKDGNANVGSQGFVEVGKFKGTSPFGIYDMVGNAWEWTSSEFRAYPNGKTIEGTNLKTIRGGSFEATKEFATTTYRLGWAATGATSYSRTGFRCVQDVK